MQMQKTIPKTKKRKENCGLAIGQNKNHHLRVVVANTENLLKKRNTNPSTENEAPLTYFKYFFNLPLSYNYLCFIIT